jgi:hypothetical protein
MCGLSGLLGPLPRGPRARAAVLETFSRLLLLSEPRGPHATGVAWMAGDGAYQAGYRPYRYAPRQTALRDTHRLEL